MCKRDIFPLRADPVRKDTGRLTGFVAFLAALALSVSLGTQSARADSSVTRSQAEANYVKAHNDYFNGLMSGQANTPEQQEALRQSTVGQATQAFSQVIYQQWQQAFSQVYTPADVAARKIEPASWANLGGILSGQKSDRSLAGGDAAGQNAGMAPLAPAPKRETALDGKGIPRVLEFKGTSTSHADGAQAEQ
jgi:hypothetical protein